MKSDIIEKWIARSNKKKARLINKNKSVYEIVFKNKNKICIGLVKDGMHVRYGIETIFSIYGGEKNSLWQRNLSTITDERMEIMIDYANNESRLIPFDFNELKSLKE